MQRALDDRQAAFVAEVESFLAAVWPATGAGGTPAGIDAWFEALAERGWTMPTWPRRFGGAALSPVQAYLLDRTLAAAGTLRPAPLLVDVVGPLLMNLGSEAQRDRWLPGMASRPTGWSVHGSLLGGRPLTLQPVPGGLRCAESSLLASGAAGADWLIGVGQVATDRLLVAVAPLADVHVEPGLPLDPDRLEPRGLVFEPVGQPQPASALERLRLTGVMPRCRAAELTVGLGALLRSVDPEDAELLARCAELEVDLAGLEALEQRAYLGAGGADPALLAAVRLRADATGASLARLAVEALGYYALPAPDPRRWHNEAPLAGSGEDAIGRLIRYVGGLDASAERDRLAALVLPGIREG